VCSRSLWRFGTTVLRWYTLTNPCCLLNIEVYVVLNCTFLCFVFFSTGGENLCINRCTQLFLFRSHQFRVYSARITKGGYTNQPAEQERKQVDYAFYIRLVSRQSTWLKIFYANVSRRVHPEFICARCASGNRKDHSWIQ
jgi:hypothetical protein